HLRQRMDGSVAQQLRLLVLLRRSVPGDSQHDPAERLIHYGRADLRSGTSASAERDPKQIFQAGDAIADVSSLLHLLDRCRGVRLQPDELREWSDQPDAGMDWHAAGRLLQRSRFMAAYSDDRDPLEGDRLRHDHLSRGVDL